MSPRGWYQRRSQAKRNGLRRMLGCGRVVAASSQIVECGHIGCCDSSSNQHASKHYAATGHPIITSFELGERWFYDYRTGDSSPARSFHSHPLDQPVPGPAGAGLQTGKRCFMNRGGSLVRDVCY